MSEPNGTQIQLRNEAIGCKAECEEMLEMTDSRLADCQGRKAEAIEKYQEVKENMGAQQIIHFHNLIALGDGLVATGNTFYIQGSQSDASADGFFQAGETHWDNGEWSEAALDFTRATIRYNPATQSYGSAHEQYGSAWSPYWNAKTYAEGFEEQP